MDPIIVKELFYDLDDLLLDFLKSLKLEEWDLITTAGTWTIKDVVSHLIDGNLRTLSMLRDEYYGVEGPIDNSYHSTVHYLNDLNASWVDSFKRISPKVMLSILKESGKNYCDYITSLDYFAEAKFSVGWAGEKRSVNWFHIARDYTEKWHHQQQIRLALGEDRLLLNDKFYIPYLDTSLRALPFHFRSMRAHDEESLMIVISGNSDKIWYLQYKDEKWELSCKKTNKLIAKVVLKDEIAWRVFTKGIKKDEAASKSVIEGREDLSMHLLNLTAVMA